MTINNFKIAWRGLSRNKSYAIINIAGLAIGISACILIGLFVFNEISFDNNTPNKKQVYRVNEYVHYDGTAPQVSAAIGPPIAPFLQANHSEIESFTRVLPATPFIYSSLVLEYQGKKIKPGEMVCTDTSFVGMFGVELLEGDTNNFVRDENSIVLTQGLARKLFGSSSALNKMLVMHTTDSTSLNVFVSDVIKDFPTTSHLHNIEGLLPITRSFEESFRGGNYGILLGPSYFRLKPNLNVVALQQKLTETLHAKNKFIDVRLQPLSQVHAGSMDVNYDFLNYQKMEGKYIKVFIIIALAIFLIACFNFINLTVAIAGYRGKEIAVKKIIGAGKTQIIMQVFAEVFLLVLLAVLLSIVLAVIFLPYLNSILNRQLPVQNLYHPVAISGYVMIVLLTTLLAGFYPAWLIASSKINKILRTKVLFAGSRTSLRNVLVTGQFTIAVIFIISLLVFFKQLKFMQEKDLGYSYSQVIQIPLDVPAATKLSVLHSELLKIKGVADVTNGYMELGGNGSLFGIDYIAPGGEAKHISVNFDNGSPNYLKFFGMKIISGRDFTKDHPVDEYIINESLAKQIGYPNPVGKSINLTSFPAGIIVGVVKDYNYSSLHNNIEPLIIGSAPYIDTWKKQLYVKISTAGIANTIKEIEAKWKLISGENSLSFQFMDEHFREVYRSERQTANMVGIIGGLTIIIACLGLLGLITFVIIRRTKEISIRKVLGASVTHIATKLSNEFIRLVLIAFIIASPIAWYFMNKWLQDFAYRTTIPWWVFAVAGILALAIALLTVSFQAIKVAVANPVENLRAD